MLVFSGRRLFWLFVGGLGFVLSLGLALQVFKGSPVWLLVAVALIIGVVGALLAVFLEKAALVAGGALAGAYLLNSLAGDLHLTAALAWAPYLIGGVIGGVLVLALFDWSLIVLSALVGGLMVTDALQLKSPLHFQVTLVLFLIGLVVQAGLLGREKRRRT